MRGLTFAPDQQTTFTWPAVTLLGHSGGHRGHST